MVEAPLNLPQDLWQYTDEQHEAVIVYLISLSMPELRKRREINKQQLAMAFKEAKQSGLDTRLERAQNNLFIAQDHLFRAIFRKNFNEDPGWNRIVEELLK